MIQFIALIVLLVPSVCFAQKGFVVTPDPAGRYNYKLIYEPSGAPDEICDQTCSQSNNCITTTFDAGLTGFLREPCDLGETLRHYNFTYCFCDGNSETDYLNCNSYSSYVDVTNLETRSPEYSPNPATGTCGVPQPACYVKVDIDNWGSDSNHVFRGSNITNFSFDGQNDPTWNDVSGTYSPVWGGGQSNGVHIWKLDNGTWTPFYIGGANSVFTDASYNSWISQTAAMNSLLFPATPLSEGCTDCQNCGTPGQPPQNCQTEADTLSSACGGAGNVSFFDAELCEGWCKDCSELAGNCNTQCENDVASYSCDGTYGTVQGSQHTVAITEQPCICGGLSCNDLANNCIASCGGQTNILSFNCVDGVVTSPCVCNNNVNPTNDPGDYAAGTPDSNDPNASPPDPNATDSEVNKNQDKNLYEIASNTHTTALNTKTIADNTQLIGQVMDQELNEANNTLKNLSAKLDAINNELDELNDGTYSPGTMGTEYTTDPFSFSDRTNQFFSELQNTPLFALPAQILTNIPDSSNSTMSFDGGIFGQHTYDFASMGSVYATLKAIFITLCGYLSVRIVILKH